MDLGVNAFLNCQESIQAGQFQNVYIHQNYWVGVGGGEAG